MASSAGCGIHAAWVADGDCATAHVHDTAFHPLSAQCDGPRVTQAATAPSAILPNLQLGRRGAWRDRMLIETVLALRTGVCHIKQMRHRVGDCFQAHWG